MKRFTILLAALITLYVQSFAAYDNSAQAAFSSGATNTTSSFTASGTNLVCVLFVWFRSGVISAPTCGGQVMTLAVTSSLFTAGNIANGSIYVCTGVTAGSITASVAATVESALFAATYNNARQSGQPDAVAPFATGNTDIGTGIFLLPVTTVANNAMFFGAFNPTGTTQVSPSTNGTLIAASVDASIQFFFWRNTTAITPAGATNFAYGSTPGVLVQGFGVSIAPSTSTITANPSVITVGP